MKAAYYTKYHTDEDRIAHRPNVIPLEDFKLLVKYWGDEAVQVVYTHFETDYLIKNIIKTNLCNGFSF